MIFPALGTRLPPLSPPFVLWQRSLCNANLFPFLFYTFFLLFLFLPLTPHYHARPYAVSIPFWPYAFDLPPTWRRPRLVPLSPSRCLSPPLSVPITKPFGAYHQTLGAYHQPPRCLSPTPPRCISPPHENGTFVSLPRTLRSRTSFLLLPDEEDDPESVGSVDMEDVFSSDEEDEAEEGGPLVAAPGVTKGSPAETSSNTPEDESE
jgi:hypothetical protein